MLFSGGGLALAFLSFGDAWKTRDFFFLFFSIAHLFSKVHFIKDLFFSTPICF